MMKMETEYKVDDNNGRMHDGKGIKPIQRRSQKMKLKAFQLNFRYVCLTPLIIQHQHLHIVYVMINI